VAIVASPSSRWQAAGGRTKRQVRERSSMHSHEFSIWVHDLDVSGRQFHFPVRAAWLRGAFEGTEVQPADHDGELDIRLSRSGRDVVVRGTLRAELVVPCARCLEPARVAVEDEVTALALESPRQTRIDPEQQEVLAETDTIAFDGETLVLDELVRDELLLGIPMIPLCSEACPGIRHEVGSRLLDGIDSSLQPLMKPTKA
jgi:uncharacterized protein